jgi:hypothetical protein
VGFAPSGSVGQRQPLCLASSSIVLFLFLPLARRRAGRTRRKTARPNPPAGKSSAKKIWPYVFSRPIVSSSIPIIAFFLPR